MSIPHAHPKPDAVVAGGQLRLIELGLKRADWAGTAVLAWGTAGLAALQAGAAGFLDESGSREYAGHRYPLRQHSFLLGRWALRAALRHAAGEAAGSALTIGRGVFQQPVLAGPGAEGWDVGISHVADHGAGLVFPRGHPMGIDVEGLTAERADSLKNYFTARERAEIARCVPDEERAVILLWSAKEALAKTLHCGLSTPLEVFEIGGVVRAGAGLQITFVNFPQFRSHLVETDGLCFALTAPAKTEIQSAFFSR